MATEDLSNVNDLNFGTTLEDPSKPDSDYAIMSTSEVYLLLSSQSSDDQTSVYNKCLGYSKRFCGLLGGMEGVSEMGREERGRGVEDLKEVRLLITLIESRKRGENCTKLR